MKTIAVRKRKPSALVLPEPPAKMGAFAKKLDAAFREILAGNVTVRQIEVAEPGVYGPKEVRALRDVIGVSQRLFAALVGVSPELVESWEQGVREPARLARRLLDTIAENPKAFTQRIMHSREMAKSSSHQNSRRRAG